MLANLLARPEVTEVCELRSRFGLMAYHGGNLERSTDAVAREVAERSGASYYAVLQQAPLRKHVSSLAFDPSHSDALAGFLDHVDIAISIHGYGRESSWHHLLIGGRNRGLASHVSRHLRSALDHPERAHPYEVVDDLDSIPKELRGQHPRNPVNRPAEAGVQIELPPTIRFNREEGGWSDHHGVTRTRDLHRLIDGLTDAVRSWRPGKAPRRDARARSSAKEPHAHEDAQEQDGR